MRSRWLWSLSLAAAVAALRDGALAERRGQVHFHSAFG